VTPVNEDNKGGRGVNKIGGGNMETILLVTLIMAAPLLGIVGFIISEREESVSIEQDQQEPQVEMELPKAA
jgi:hypothetical protein